MHKDSAAFAGMRCDLWRLAFGRNKQRKELNIDSFAPRNHKRRLYGRMRARRHSLKDLRWHTAQNLERHRSAFVIEASPYIAISFAALRLLQVHIPIPLRK